jgi:HEAT repeat protein
MTLDIASSMLALRGGVLRARMVHLFPCLSALLFHFLLVPTQAQNPQDGFQELQLAVLNGNDEEQRGAFDNLVAKPPENVLPSAANWLAGKNTRMSDMAAELIARLALTIVLEKPDTSKPFIPLVDPLLAALRNGANNAREFSAEALGLIGQRSEEVVPILEMTLKSDSWKVRLAAARALEKFGPAAHRAAGELRRILRTTTEANDVRCAAALALGAMNNDDADVQRELFQAAKDRYVRHSAVEAVLRLGPLSAKAAIKYPGHETSLEAFRVLKEEMNTNRIASVMPALIETLAVINSVPRRRAAASLLAALPEDFRRVNLMPSQSLVINRFSEAGQDLQVRTSLLTTLVYGTDEPLAPEVASTFLEIINSGHEAKELRLRVIEEFAKRSVDSRVYPILVSSLRSDDMPDGQSSMLAALSRSKSVSDDAIHAVTQLTGRPSTHPNVRGEAIALLGRVAATATNQQAFECLQEIASDPGRMVTLRVAAAKGLLDTGRHESLGAILSVWRQCAGQWAPEDFERGFTLFLPRVMDRAAVLPWNERSQIARLLAETPRLENVHGVNMALGSKYLQTPWLVQLRDWVSNNTWVAGPLAWALGFNALWVLLLAVYPAGLTRISELTSGIAKLKVPGLDFEASPRALTFLLLYHHHPRALGAWVRQRLPNARLNFAADKTVSRRSEAVALPVKVGNTEFPELDAHHLASVFARQRSFIVIFGEGGSGKTTLACQVGHWGLRDARSELLASHPMLPVLLDQELDEDKKPHGAFIGAIRARLRDLTDDKVAVSEELVLSLLRTKRILVIIDRFSESTKVTRRSIRIDLPDFPANALIVTSRKADVLGGVGHSTIMPMRIQTAKLFTFLENYFVYRKVHDRFDATTFNELGMWLSRMAAGREITVMLASIYAKVVINVLGEKSGAFVLKLLPRNIPGLIVDCLKELNASTPNPLPDKDVLRDAMLIGWECLRVEHVPAPADRSVAIKAIEPFHGEKAGRYLAYLEEELQLLQSTGVEGEQIRFTLDPLAEALAARALLTAPENDLAFWKSFIEENKRKTSPMEARIGFLQALVDTDSVLKALPSEIASHFQQMTNVQS